MISKILYTSCILCLFCTAVYGQYDKRYQSPEEKIAQAEKIQHQSPQKAIQLLEKVIAEKGKGKNDYEAKAYILLGNIYEAIEEEELAKQRYQQAETFISTKNPELWSENRFWLGNLDLKSSRFEDAKENFNLCIDRSPESDWALKCREGLADVELAKSNFDNSLENINIIQQTYGLELDSTTNARLEAKKSQAYIQQNKLSEAELAYSNSVKIAPRNLSKKDIDVLEETEELFIKKSSTADSKIARIEKNLQQKMEEQFPPESIVSDQLLLADLHLQKKELDQAENYILAAREKIADTPNPELKATVFKQSSKINLAKKDYQRAYEDLQAYVTNIDIKEDLQQSQKAKNIDILKGQRKIDIVEKDRTIQEKETQLLQNQLSNQRSLIGLLSLLLLASLVSFVYIMKNVRAKRKANQMLLLKSLRTQMNPHFIFNALNSVNSFIIKNDERAANKFLSDFSKLMRMVLDNSQKDFIALEEELNLLSLYLKLEHTRFRDKFDYQIKKNIDASSQSIEIPPMLIQPFIENAVWHGLRYKQRKGQLELHLSEQEHNLIISIQDNGIGRTQSKALKTTNQKKYNSTGIRNIDERIELINKLYNKNYQIHVQDVYPDTTDTGTLVQIKIPKQR